MNEQSIEIKPNNILSDVDKSFLAIHHIHPLTRLPLNKSSASNPDDVVNHVKSPNQSLFPSTSVGLAPTIALTASLNASSGVEMGNFLEIIVNSLKQVFAPTTGQIFTFQFPGRFLQQDLYAWLSGHGNDFRVMAKQLGGS